MTDLQTTILLELQEMASDELMYPLRPHVTSAWAAKHVRHNIPGLVVSGYIKIINNRYHLTKQGQEFLSTNLSA